MQKCQIREERGSRVGVIREDALEDPMLGELAARRVLMRRYFAQQTFADALLRREWAGEHLADLKGRVESFVEQEQDAVSAQFRAKGVEFDAELTEPPRELSVLIGEIAYNL